MNEILETDSTAFDLSEIIIEQMGVIYWRTLWEKPDFVLSMFHRASRQRHLSTNTEAFDLLVGDGENAIKANDVDELRGIVLGSRSRLTLQRPSGTWAGLHRYCGANLVVQVAALLA